MWESVRVLKVEKGDTIVIHTDDFSAKNKERIKEDVRLCIGRELSQCCNVLLVKNNTDIGILKNRTGEFWDLFEIK